MLYLITNRNIIKAGDLYSVIKEAADGGVDAVILREKDLSFEELLPIADKIKDIIENKNVKLIINGNMDVAKKIKAHGIHIGFKKFMEQKHEFDGLVGVSVHSLEEAVLAEKNGADYVFASHVYETDCKKGLKPRGINFIKKIRENIGITLIGLGGINEKNAQEVICAGIDGIAVMSYIMADKNPYAATKILKDSIR
ncbi:thiamine phosphate synthase [Clostridium aestuarii]|uniref:Thiamine-phosphate synthase n=1 Tax=Clostridium aestuarii TaxID=338193 RepID=A0ABT4CYX1_9CLOT|nr:thiamine phosphate synthase [Clostridium aestuarii]MCY6484187.1 thiamine phosphate synthase [Clostridium aestuarii]